MVMTVHFPTKSKIRCAAPLAFSMLVRLRDSNPRSSRGHFRRAVEPGVREYVMISL